jgi:hypothetical protein
VMRGLDSSSPRPASFTPGPRHRALPRAQAPERRRHRGRLPASRYQGDRLSAVDRVNLVQVRRRRR